jgi:hypothetical protein
MNSKFHTTQKKQLQAAENKSVLSANATKDLKKKAKYISFSQHVCGIGITCLFSMFLPPFLGLILISIAAEIHKKFQVEKINITSNNQTIAFQAIFQRIKEFPIEFPMVGSSSYYILFCAKLDY